MKSIKLKKKELNPEKEKKIKKTIYVTVSNLDKIQQIMDITGNNFQEIVSISIDHLIEKNKDLLK